MSHNRWTRPTLAILALLLAVPPACGGRKTGGGGGKTPGGVKLHPVFTQARDSVFLIGGAEAGLMGTAFLFEHEGKRWLVTNFHVAAFMQNPYIQTEKKVAYKDLHLLAGDRRNDVAVLDASSLPHDLKALRGTLSYATSEPIYILGYPDMRSAEDHINFGTGVVSDAAYIAPVYIGEGDCSNIQITAPVSPGSSGSPVLNERAEVIGVVAWSFTPEDDIVAGNYAVPLQHVLDLIDEIEARKGADPSSLYPAGGPCDDDGGCLWTNFCIDASCQPLRALGGPCGIDDDCFLPYICTKGVCTRAGGLGDPCHSDSQCEPPHFCIMDTCGPLSKKDGPCRLDIDCVEPLLCIAGTCTTELSDAGGPCAVDDDCWAPLQCKGGACAQP